MEGLRKLEGELGKSWGKPVTRTKHQINPSPQSPHLFILCQNPIPLSLSTISEFLGGKWSPYNRVESLIPISRHAQNEQHVDRKPKEDR